MYILNLRLFDAAPVQTTTILSADMAQYYEKRLLQTAGPNLVFAQFADKYPIPKTGGKTINMRRYSSLAPATTAITEGVTPDGNSLEVTNIPATIDQYGDFVRLSDILELTAIDNNVVQATKVLGAQAGKTLDCLTRDVVCGGTNKFLAPTVSSAGVVTEVEARDDMDATSALSADLIFAAVAFLEAQDAPKINGHYIGIIHPYAKYELMKSPEWRNLHQYASPEEAFEGEIGMLGGVRFVESSNAKVWKDSTCPSDGASGYLAVFGTMIVGAHAYGETEVEGGGLEHIVKPLGYGEDPLNQRSSVGWKATHVAKRLNEAWMVRIESTSGRFSKTATAN